MTLALIGLGQMAAAEAPQIHLVACGSVPPAALAGLADGLRQELGFKVDPAGEVQVPSAAYAPRRRQYQAEPFLPLIRPYRQQAPDLVLGITGVDLYVPSLNFVFGLADPRTRCAIISLARLDPQYYGQAADPRRFQERALKEAVHELGHLLGLSHCRRPDCVMFFSNSLADTDRKGQSFCPDCRRSLVSRFINNFNKLES
jgi:archaemetzincin